MHIYKTLVLTWLLTFGGAVGLAQQLSTPSLRFQIDAQTGRYSITDIASGQVWESNPRAQRFGQATFTRDGQRQTADLSRCQVAQEGNGLRLTFEPVRVTITPVSNGTALRFSYEPAAGVNVESIRLLDDSLSTTGDGYVAVPVREGLLIPADSGLAFTHTFDTYAYEGCHMTMIGVVKGGSAALITWDDPYTAAEVRSTLNPNGDPKQALSLSMILRKSARSCTITLLGKGNYVTIAKAYKDVAQKKGYRVTWDQKIKENPARAKLLGAIDFKLWSTLSRRMNEDSTKEESVRVNWTFDEVGQIAEHLKKDLKLDKVHFIIGGWIHRGYDNQHPDILPAAPECGGSEGLAAAAKKVREQGYIFDLHDNYQDMYKDSPSWDEQYLQKLPDGKPQRGGRWAGGYAYITCSKKAVELARRPQNLEAVKKLTNADCYFIDTTYAAGLQECFDPNHPLTRADDMKWKQEISDYARSVFGMFGSECGREWAIPHADYFEGLTGVSGTYYHDAGLLKKVGGTVIPLFELVYRDCIQMYGKYGYNINNSAEYVLHHLSIGRTLNYHSIPQHLYWKNEAKDAGDQPGAMYVRGDNGWAAGMHPMDRFVKNTYEILSPLLEITARMEMTDHRFLTPDRKVRQTVFGSGTYAVTVTVNGSSEDFRSVTKPEVVLPPFGFMINSREFWAFCARSIDGQNYGTPTCFTIQSRNGSTRIFHAFGDKNVRVGERIIEVEKEQQEQRVRPKPVF